MIVSYTHTDRDREGGDTIPGALERTTEGYQWCEVGNGEKRAGTTSFVGEDTEAEGERGDK